MDTENGETAGQCEDSEHCQRLKSPRACAHLIESEVRNKTKKPFPGFTVNCKTEFKDGCYLLLVGISVSHHLEPTRR